MNIYIYTILTGQTVLLKLSNAWKSLLISSVLSPIFHIPPMNSSHTVGSLRNPPVGTFPFFLEWRVPEPQDLPTVNREKTHGRSSGSDWLEVPTIYKAYFSGLNFRDLSPENIALYGTVPPSIGSWSSDWKNYETRQGIWGNKLPITKVLWKLWKTYEQYYQ